MKALNLHTQGETDYLEILKQELKSLVQKIKKDTTPIQRRKTRENRYAEKRAYRQKETNTQEIVLTIKTIYHEKNPIPLFSFHLVFELLPNLCSSGFFNQRTFSFCYGCIR